MTELNDDQLINLLGEVINSETDRHLKLMNRLGEAANGFKNYELVGAIAQLLVDIAGLDDDKIEKGECPTANRGIALMNQLALDENLTMQEILGIVGSILMVIYVGVLGRRTLGSMPAAEAV